MSTFVGVNVRTYSATFVANNILRSIRQIIRDSGLSTSKMTDQWAALEAGVATWLKSGHLKALILEVYDLRDILDDRRGRFDFTIDYSYGDDDGELWLDPDVVSHAIRKNGSFPSQCEYRLVADVSDGAPSVLGWSSATLRSTEGFSRHTVGTATAAAKLGASLAYYKKGG